MQQGKILVNKLIYLLINLPPHNCTMYMVHTYIARRNKGLAKSKERKTFNTYIC